MQLVIKINLDNAAFADDGCGYEVARILHTLAAKVEGDSAADMDIVGRITLLDINGNRVGSAFVEE